MLITNHQVVLETVELLCHVVVVQSLFLNDRCKSLLLLQSDSTTLTTRSIDGPTMSSSEGGIPLGSPTRKTETHSLGPNGPTVVSSKVQTIETTTVRK